MTDKEELPPAPTPSTAATVTLIQAGTKDRQVTIADGDSPLITVDGLTYQRDGDTNRYTLGPA